jgi:hypothetical protein
VRHAKQSTIPASAVPTRLSVAIGAFLALGLLFSASASAGFEQVGTFGESGEGNRLSQATGLAVNTIGAGGVPAGTVYAVADKVEPTNYVSRYSPKGEFREAWGWSVSNPALSPPQFERCGPDGEPAHPVCGDGSAGLGEGAGQLWRPRGVAVDQTTGYVYVLNEGYSLPPGRKHNLVQVFSADGSQLIASFGDLGGGAETFDEGPERIHQTFAGGIAVDASGAVYVVDQTQGVFPAETRAMVFRPQSPGDYEHYVYAGRASDIATSHDGVNYFPRNLSVDDAGNLYVNGGASIYKFTPADPDTPACEYEVADEGNTRITVNPTSGDVFYFDYKNKKIHQLSACDAQGEFEETGAFTPLPKTSRVEALAYNPVLAWEASRPLGILYAADAGLGNAGEPGRVDVFAPAEIHFPAIELESVSSVTSATAQLGAKINPKGSSTHYYFQYITKAAYEANEPAERFAGATEAPLGGTDIPASQEALGAGASLVGLQPDSEYHYRVIATSHCEPEHPEELCQATGEDKSFRTFPVEAPGLPDNRAWELVSPAQKNGGEVFPAELGDVGCQVECNPGFFAQTFPMQSSSGGEAVVYEGFPFSSTEGAARVNEYISRRDEKSGWQTTILAPALFNSTHGLYTAFNDELTQGILFQPNPSLTPEAPSEYANLYTQPTSNPSSLTPLLGFEPPDRAPGFGNNVFNIEYVGASDDFTHLFFAANDALTGETPFAPEAVDGGAEGFKGNNLYESVGGELRLVNVLPGNEETVPGARFGPVAANTISADGSRAFWSDQAGQVYVRENGESTIAIPDPGKYLSASDDGSRVLFANGHLYDLETEAITDLTGGEGGFEGIAGQSDDLSRIYFVDTAVLTGEEENGQGAKAEAGKNNLYAWHNGQTSFIATLPASSGNNWDATPNARRAEASPDGRWFAFTSNAQLTGYDNVGGCHYGTETVPCPEAFLYDSNDGTLRCASCNPSGVPPLGPDPVNEYIYGGARLNAFGTQADYLPQPRFLLDSGRLYFDTTDSLVPADTNDGVMDAYQYEPEGIGSCGREGGCVSLISAGRERSASNFLTTDPRGENIFFTSRDQLVLKDRDDLIDLYDARAGGGIGAETETSRGECQGEACQSSLVAPNDPTPGSSSFEGAGNVVERPSGRKHHKRKHRHHARKRRHQRTASHNRGGA